MLENKPLTQLEAEAMITMLEAVADRLFLAGYNTLGNSVQETVYCMVPPRFDRWHLWWWRLQLWLCLWCL